MSTAQLQGEQPQHPVPTCCYGHLVSEELQREARWSMGGCGAAHPPGSSAASGNRTVTGAASQTARLCGGGGGEGECRAGTDPETQS